MASCSLGEAALLVFLLYPVACFRHFLATTTSLYQWRTGFPLFPRRSAVTSLHVPQVCVRVPVPSRSLSVLQLPTCSLPLQHPPDFCPFQVTKPINPLTHFLICRLALVFLFPSNSAHIISPPPHLYLLHTAFISILK